MCIHARPTDTTGFISVHAKWNASGGMLTIACTIRQDSRGIGLSDRLSVHELVALLFKACWQAYLSRLESNSKRRRTCRLQVWADLSLLCSGRVTSLRFCMQQLRKLLYIATQQGIETCLLLHTTAQHSIVQPQVFNKVKSTTAQLSTGLHDVAQKMKKYHCIST